MSPLLSHLATTVPAVLLIVTVVIRNSLPQPKDFDND